MGSATPQTARKLIKCITAPVLFLSVGIKLNKMSDKKLTVFEKCEAIKNAILRAVGEAMAYDNWSDEFKLKNIAETPEIVSKWEDKYGSFKIDPSQMTTEELKKLGFGKWDEENEMMLIPIWLYPYLAEKLDTISISGSKHTTKAEIDTDHRFGNLAYGVIPCDGKNKTTTKAD